MPKFDTTLQLSEPAASVEARLVAALSQGYGGTVSAKPGLIVLSRKYRPGWVIVLAILGALFFLLGLLFLLYTKTDTLTVSISPHGDVGCTVVVAGEATPWAIHTVQQALANPAVRQCPNCKQAMRRGATVCPQCGFQSTPWKFHAGVWWLQTEGGDWQWLEESTWTWRWYKDGTPVSEPDGTPSNAIDPARVTPPPTVELPVSSASGPDATRSASSSSRADELEKLAALHERGVLSDEEFQAAKAGLLGL